MPDKSNQVQEKILVVEDDVEFADLLGLLLTKKGYKTKVTYSGEAAVEAAPSFAPDIIIQDYMLPDISGVHLLSKLKHLCPETNVIVITAKGDDQAAAEIMKAGATDYLRKPFDTDKFLLSIENTLKLRTSQMAFRKLRLELRGKNNELMALNAISSALVSSMPLNEKYKSAVGIVRKNMKADVANIFIVTGTDKKLKLIASEGLEGNEFTECNLSRGKGLVSYVQEIKKTAFAANFKSENRFKVPVEIHERGLTSGLAVPLLVKGSVKGVLAVYTKQPRTFNSFEMKLMGNFGNVIALSVKMDYLNRLLGNFQRQWQVTLDLIPDRLTLQDTDHNIIMANRAAAKVAGLEARDIVGQRCSWLFHTSKEPMEDCPVSESIQTLEPSYKEMMLGGKLCQVWASPVIDEDGNLLAIAEYVREPKD